MLPLLGLTVIGKKSFLKKYQVFGQKKIRRIIAYRKKVKGQLRIDQKDGNDYHAILTNDTAGPNGCYLIL